MPPKDLISERITFSVVWFVLVMDDDVPKILLTPLFSLLVFRVNLLGWASVAAFKTIYFPKKQLCVMHCSRLKRLSWFCFLFRSCSRITGLLGKS